MSTLQKGGHDPLNKLRLLIQLKFISNGKRRRILLHSLLSELGNAVVIVVPSMFLANGYSSPVRKPIVQKIIKISRAEIQYYTLAKSN